MKGTPLAMTIVPRSKLYLTALSILFVVLLLLVFISVSTYRNLDRERNASLKTVRRQALTLINALEAGARAGMMMQMSGEDAIGNLVHEIGDSEDINYVYLINAAGEVVHHSIPSMEGTRALWRPVFEGPAEVVNRMRRLKDGNRVYEVAKPFSPMEPDEKKRIPGVDLHASAEPRRQFHARATVFLGMNLNTYEAAREADLHHAAIMGGIVLALGGGVIYFFIVIRSYYRLSRRLQKTQEYTRQVIASMVHGVLSIDKDGCVVSHNQQGLSLLSVSRSMIVQGFNLRTVLDFDKTGITGTLESGIPVLNHEIEVAQPSGNPIPLVLTVTPIEDEAGERGGAVVVVRDMSAIKDLQEQMRRTERLAAIGKLAAGVAHEIRNPLSSIRGFAYLLGKNHGKDTPEREYADVMVTEIDRINHVVSNLLNYARPMTLEPEATRVEPLIGHVISLVSADAKKQCIHIHLDVEPQLPPMSLDPNQVSQAILNLLLNMIHVLGEGGQINIRVGGLEDGKALAIHVEDNGPGIAPELQERIFEPFFTTKAQGTGIGLSMVRKISESHGGSVRVLSPPPGKTTGTRFVLFLRSVDAQVTV